MHHPYKDSPLHKTRPSPIHGAHFLLASAFRWEDSLEGENYWEDVYLRFYLLQEDVFSSEPIVKPTMRDTISYPNVIEKMKISLDSLNPLIEYVTHNFEWSLTYEGWSYWEDVANALSLYSQHCSDPLFERRTALLTFLSIMSKDP